MATYPRGGFLRFLLAFIALCALVQAAQKPTKAVLLSNVKSLTLRKGAKTSHRRVSAVPQLKCIGGNGRPHYEIDVLRCKNEGADYDDQNIQWTCTASLPPEFKLGSTDVICEGYDSPEDPYVLKGSCGVEYRLVLTELGEQKFGKGSGWFGGGQPNDEQGEDGGILAILFWIFFIGVLLWMLYAVFISPSNQNRNGGRNFPRRPGGGGGGGYHDDDDNNDPPPPYDYQPPRSTRKTWASSSTPRSTTQSQGGFRPGFWSGVLGGGAAGYAAGRATGGGGANSNQSRNGYYRDQQQQRTGGWFGQGVGGGGGAGAGRSGGSSSSSSGNSSAGSSASSSRYESTGFGDTRRR